MNGVVRELTVYFAYVAIVFLISYGNRDPNAYWVIAFYSFRKIIPKLREINLMIILKNIVQGGCISSGGSRGPQLWDFARGRPGIPGLEFSFASHALWFPYFCANSFSQFFPAVLQPQERAPTLRRLHAGA